MNQSFIHSTLTLQIRTAHSLSSTRDVVVLAPRPADGYAARAMRRICLAAVLAAAALPQPSLASDTSTAWMTNPQHNGELTDSPVRPPLAARWDVRLGTVTSNVLVADVAG